jgi:hypothetical protein
VYLWVALKLPTVVYLHVKMMECFRLDYILIMISRKFSGSLEVRVMFILFLLHIIQISFYLTILCFLEPLPFRWQFELLLCLMLYPLRWPSVYQMLSFVCVMQQQCMIVHFIVTHSCMNNYKWITHCHL